MTTALSFECPSCHHKLATVEAMSAATQIVKRACRSCGEQWQLKVEPLMVKAYVGRVDRAEFTFLGRKELAK